MVGCGLRSALLSAASAGAVPCRSGPRDTPCASSFATPTAAAAAAVTRQYFVEGFYPSGRRQAGDSVTPSGALLKAVLLNSAVGLASGSPDDSAGWGLLHLPTVLFFGNAGRGLFIRDVRHSAGLATGDAVNVSVQVDSDQAPLRVTLVWSDAPGGSGSDHAAVNNLDLEIVAPNGDRFLGNVFADGASVSGGTPDAVNNVEMVSVRTRRQARGRSRCVPPR